MSTAAKASRFHMAGFGVCEMLAEKDIRNSLKITPSVFIEISSGNLCNADYETLHQLF